MSALAELVARQGMAVSGSDLRTSDQTSRLSNLGVTCFEGHAAAHVGAADVVVVSSAIPAANPEIVEAKRRGIPVIQRADLLAALMRSKTGIAVAGAHGKTSTTSMIALVMERAGLDPTAIIGGRFSAFDSNARLGHGDHLVAEADESDRSFLKLAPVIAVITNVDREHMEAYRSFDDLLEAFVRFGNAVPFYGLTVLCADDASLRTVRTRFTGRVVTYGLNQPDATVVARDVVLRGLSSQAQIFSGSSCVGELTLRVPGRHSVQNALAAIAVGLELDIPFERIAEALAAFTGAERRFQMLGEEQGVLVVDDYGHHPTEIRAVLQAARGLDRRVIVVFQPHRFSRTAQLLDEFGPALAEADEIVLTGIYAADEAPIPGVTLDRLAEAVRRSTDKPVQVIENLHEVPAAVAAGRRRGDVVITFGAGSIGTIGRQILEAVKERRP